MELIPIFGIENVFNPINTVTGRAIAVLASEFFRLYFLADGHSRRVNVLGSGEGKFSLPPELAAVNILR